MRTMVARRTLSPIRLVIGLLAVVVLTQGCAPHYLATNFESTYQARTRVVAIAPLANLTTDPEGARAGQAIRQAIFYELTRKQDHFTVTIQDVDETDKKIRDASMTDSAASRLPGADLCKMLGVDAVMKGSVTRYVKKGAGAQFATAILFGFAKGSEVKADVAIYDGQDGKMIWQHNIEKAGGFLSSPDALRNSVGATVAGKFPYKKKS